MISMRLKKTKRKGRRPGRIDKESFGGCGRFEREDRNVLSGSLSGFESAVVQFQPVAGPDSKGSGFGEASGAEEGGAL